jgi:hypothetical protein
MATKTLLDRARAQPIGHKSRNSLPEHQLEDLAIAYMKSDIRFVAVEKVLKRTGNSAYGIIASSLRRAYAKGRIKISKA